MHSKDVLRIVMIALLTLAIGLAATAQGWAQQVSPQMATTSSTPAPDEDRPVANALATAAAVVGSLFYIPFKLAVICPGMALASGASLAVTGGDKATAEYLLRVGCTGTYFVTPQMVRGQEEFHGAGER
jgi:ABC-type Fe3+ transport system permease subunit